MTDPIPSTPASDPRLTADGFTLEQEQLGKCWNFLGFDYQIPRVDDWFTVRLGGRSIFVQRFEEHIAAFDNRCVHRGFPLRVGLQGNGPVLCGFHHWRYDSQGKATGIPQCGKMYGTTPRQMDVKLKRVEIAQCGSMIFGRFAGGDTITLQEWLGPGFDILEHLSAMAFSGDPRLPGSGLTVEVKANWRFMMDISLDDMHVVAVHPTTFGRYGFLMPKRMRYARFGAHSHMSYGDMGGGISLDQLHQACIDKTFIPNCYHIFQFFPSIIVVIGKATEVLGEAYWVLGVQRLQPEGHDRTLSRSMFFPLHPRANTNVLRHAVRRVIWSGVLTGAKKFGKTIHQEDNSVCELLQLAYRANPPPPRLAAFERRIGWFDDTYRRIRAGETLTAALHEECIFPGEPKSPEPGTS